MRRTIRTVPWLGALLVAAIPAQQTWTVSESGGGNFTTLQAALAAASPGDTILVLPGTYDATLTTSKGVALLGGAAVNIMGQFALDGLPAGQTFAMKGFTGNSFFWLTQLVVRSCQGDVVLEDVNVSAAYWDPNQLTWVLRTAITIADSRFVSIAGGTLSGGPAVSIVRSSVVVENASVSGRSTGTSFLMGAAAIQCDVGQLVLAGGVVSGGTGSVTFWGHGYPGPSMSLVDCDLLVTGDQATLVQEGAMLTCGFGPCYGGSTAPGLSTVRGSVTWDPRVPSAPAPGVGPTGTVFAHAYVPYVAAAGAAPGGSLATRITGRANSAAFLFVSLPAPPTPTAFGTTWFNLSNYVLPYAAFLDPAGNTSANLPVGLGYPRGQAWLLQAATLDALGIGVSNPAVVVLH